MSDQDRVVRRYRRLPREEPPAALDAAILEAARRPAAGTSRTRRWGPPIAVAAVLVLGIGVVLRMQQEPPETGSVPGPAPAAPAAEERRSEPAPRTMQAPAAAPEAGIAPQRAKREAADAAAGAAAAASPEAELERIAGLRKDGRHAEADQAIEAFRRAHPGYRIPDAVWERIRPR